ncbi:MAG TPA: heme-binding domain-containing protein [Polyangia bacterium]|nr:heme-binding domain-containing protein [Polyangia bacterium]
MRKTLRWLALVLVAVGVALQFVPVQDLGSNPPHRFTLDAPPEVTAILRRACFDCHSNETRWPLYSRIAPGSWLLASDVHKGRNHLNFSEWGSVDDEERQDDLEACWDQVESGTMPPKKYLYPFHMSAKLSESDKMTLKAYFLKNAGKKDDKKKE